MKKKRADEDEASLERHFETPDNKETNDLPIDSGAVESMDELSGDNEEFPPEDGESNKAAADKVDKRERELQEKLAEMQDKYIRLSAEFDNYRKRTLREKMDLTKYASENLLVDLLPVIDDFDRAVDNMESSVDFTALKNGLDLIYVKFNDFLKQSGVREIESLNRPFNVDLHDAVAKVAVEEEEKKGKIVDVIQKGYYLQDKVIRHAKVVVGE